MRVKTKLWGLILVIFAISSWTGTSLATAGKPLIGYSEDENASLIDSQFSSGTWTTGATVASTTGKQFRKVLKTHPIGNEADRITPSPLVASRVQTQYLNLPMRFEANQGQTNFQVNFISRGSGYTLFLTPTEAVIALRKEEHPPLASSRSKAVSAEHSFSVVRMKLVGANPSAKVTGLEELPGKSNYFTGDPSQWRTRVPNYKKVEYRDIYPGIHLIYYGSQRQLEYDFVIAPEADPELITLSFEGCEKVRISEGGDLIIGIAGGKEISFHKPHIYQEVEGIKRPVQGGYIITPHSYLVGFKVSSYDRKSPLVIDPTLSYSTYLGGSSADYGYGIAVNSSGNAYVTGQTASTNFPTSGAYQPSIGGGTDAFVTKLAADGASLVYSTYLGGSGNDGGRSIAADSSGNAYVAGCTASTNFPTTSGAYQTSSGGGTSDAFVTKLAADGASLVYSTYLGGSDYDCDITLYATVSIAVNSSGNAYVTGYTSSTNFPTTSGAYQTSNAGGEDAFVAKIDPSQSGSASLIYSTYLGGSDNDACSNGKNSIAVDSSGNAYVTACTYSTNFPTTSGAYQTSNLGGYDAFVAKLDPSQSGSASLIYSTYLGGTGNDNGYGIAVNSSGNAYVTGNTDSADFPATSGAYQTSISTSPDGFVANLAPDGKSLVYSTYLGGNGEDVPFSIAVDAIGDAYMTGYTASTNFPTTTGAYQTSHGGGAYDVFVTELTPNGGHLRYATYLGSSGTERGYSVAVDSSGNAFVTGYTTSSTFPTTGAYQSSHGGGTYDAFVSKFSEMPTIGGFNYRMSITVNSNQLPNSQCGGSSLSSFPFLFNTTDDRLKTVANGGRVENNNGYDIIFRAEDTTTCQGSSPCSLKHEIEKYDRTTGQLVAWVKVPSINNGTVIYMYYGNPAIISSTEDRTGVWESNNYIGVWHLPNGTTLSTVNTITETAGTNYNVSPASGQVDGGGSYDATTERINTDITAHATQRTYSIWTYRTGDGGGTAGRMFQKGSYSTYTELLSNSTSNYRYYRGWSGANAYWTFTRPSTDAWHYIVVTYDSSNSSNDPLIYVDGYAVTVTEAVAPSGSPNTDATAYSIGNGTGGARNWGGSLDEFRISDTIRSACWIATEWNNQSSPSGFYTIADASSPTAVTLTDFSATEYEDGVLVKWKTGYEVDSLGFNLYREENGERLRLTPEPVAGSALLAGAGIHLQAGHSYSWWDTTAVSSKYWLEDIDLKGKRTWHGPIEAKPTGVRGQPSVFLGSRFSADQPRQSILLSEFAKRLNEKYGTFWRARELRERLLQSSAVGPREASKPIGFSPVMKGPSPQALGVDPSRQRVQWSLASKAAVKIEVREQGWYRISQPELVAAGLDPKADPRRLQLFVEGEEQPIVVKAKKGWTFDPGDLIEFYGEGLDTPFTDIRTYWLIEGKHLGKRTKGARGRGAGVEARSFPFTEELKERSIYFAALKNGESDNFFGPLITAEPAYQIANVSHLDPSSVEALLEVSFQGVTAGPHRVKILLNEVELGVVAFDGKTHHTSQVRIPSSLLLEGENLVTLAAQGGETDLSLLDSIRLTYWHTYRADQDVLRLTLPRRHTATLRGFTSPNIRVMDITNPKEVREVRGEVKWRAEGFAITLGSAFTRERALLAFTEEQIKTPVAIKANQPSEWHQKGQAADLVIIAHSNFIENVTPLKQFRQTQGYSVALIDVEDLHDEFSFGTKTPQAIKDFLARAKTYWQTPPRFVLLLGDASYDPRNYLGLGNYDFVPTKLVETSYMETASDDWFVDFNGDGLPDMAIGRLPVRDPVETATVVSKIINYEQASAGNWTKEVLLVADQNGDFDFEQASQNVGDLFPEEMKVWGIFRGQAGDETARSAVLGSINEGKLMVNYLGHGSVDSWRGNLLMVEDVLSFTNSPLLSFVVGMTCFNGFFQTPYVESLAEALLKAENGGAVAVWTSSGLTYPDEQSMMNKELVRLLFNGEGLTIGEAASQAKAATNDSDVRRSWILFGDPTTKLKY